MLLCGLLDRDFSANALHHLFAYLRTLMVNISNDEMAATYAPLGEVGWDVGAFPLHCDLFLSEILFTVFDQAALDHSGASLFLSVSQLRELMERDLQLQPDIVTEITHTITARLENDGFDQLFRLLYCRSWTRRLTSAMKAQQFRVKLETGQGYIINDRRWLHGREAPSEGVPTRRLRRLSFHTSRESL